MFFIGDKDNSHRLKPGQGFVKEEGLVYSGSLLKRFY